MAKLELLILVLAAAIFQCGSNPVPGTEPWRDPCNCSQGGPALNSNFSQLLRKQQEGAANIQAAAKAWKEFLTDGPNPPVPETLARQLNASKTRVKNFPYDFQDNPNQIVIDVLVVDYVYLSKLYIFFEQARLSIDSCNTNHTYDKSIALSKISSILTYIRQTLCTVDIYLRSSGRPMPPDQIPAKSDVLDESCQSTNIEQLCESCANRNSVDYVNARDTETTSGLLHKQCVDQFNLLFSPGGTPQEEPVPSAAR